MRTHAHMFDIRSWNISCVHIHTFIDYVCQTKMPLQQWKNDGCLLTDWIIEWSITLLIKTTKIRSTVRLCIQVSTYHSNQLTHGKSNVHKTWQIHSLRYSNPTVSTAAKNKPFVEKKFINDQVHQPSLVAPVISWRLYYSAVLTKHHHSTSITVVGCKISCMNTYVLVYLLFILPTATGINSNESVSSEWNYSLITMYNCCISQHCITLH